MRRYTLTLRQTIPAAGSFASAPQRDHSGTVAVHTIIQRLEGVSCIGVNVAAWFLKSWHRFLDEVMSRRSARQARPAQLARLLRLTGSAGKHRCQSGSWSWTIIS